jgi:hypothetical protein
MSAAILSGTEMPAGSRRSVYSLKIIEWNAALNAPPKVPQVQSEAITPEQIAQTPIEKSD